MIRLGAKICSVSLLRLHWILDRDADKNTGVRLQRSMRMNFVDAKAEILE